MNGRLCADTAVDQGGGGQESSRRRGRRRSVQARRLSAERDAGNRDAGSRRVCSRAPRRPHLTARRRLRHRRLVPGGGGQGGEEGAGRTLLHRPEDARVFASPEAAEGEGEAAAERGRRSIRQARVKGAETVRAELNELRGKDEEADSSRRRRQRARPPLPAAPLRQAAAMQHPPAAEFGDAFIAGTPERPLRVARGARAGVAADGARGRRRQGLPHKQKAALNSATALLNEAKKVAHKLAHAMRTRGGSGSTARCSRAWRRSSRATPRWCPGSSCRRPTYQRSPAIPPCRAHRVRARDRSSPLRHTPPSQRR